MTPLLKKTYECSTREHFSCSFIVAYLEMKNDEKYEHVSSYSNNINTASGINGL